MRISDWSSDVCSADLLAVPALGGQPGIHTARWAGPQRDFLVAMRRVHEELGDSPDRRGFFCCNLSVAWPDGATASFEGRIEGTQIGSASCRERGCRYGEISVVAVSLQKKKTLESTKHTN